MTVVFQISYLSILEVSFRFFRETTTKKVKTSWSINFFSARMSKRKDLYKIILLGESGVGKSALLRRFGSDKFSSQFPATVGSDFITKEVFIEDSIATLQVWDVAGNERFRSLGTGFYRGADACILVYDITDASSFDKLESWIDDFIVHANPRNADTFPFILVGNKRDSPGFKRQVTLNKAKTMFKEFPLFEVSAKENIGVKEVFDCVGGICAKQKVDAYVPTFIGVNLAKPAGKKITCCK